MTQFTTDLGRTARRLALFTVALAVTATGTAAAHGGGSYGGGVMGGYGPTGGWWPLVGMLVQLVFLLVLLGGGYLVLRRVTESQSSGNPTMEELRMAYARGDLADEEFETRRETLERSE